MGTLGTVSGIALVPGVSRNGRLYTAEAIGRAVARAQERLADGMQPLTMLTHHAADDDSTQIVGQIAAIEQDEDGAARFTAELADTGHARTIASLVDTRDGKPYLRGVSIRGAWVGKVRRQVGPDGTPLETADDLELDGLDFTRKPGVPGARVDTYTPAGTAPEETAPEGRVFITESVQEALVHTVTEAADGADASGEQGPFADPGYQKDKKKRYPIDSRAHAKAAWSYVNQADNARLYTAAQLKRVKQRITKALRGYGVTVAAQEGWLIDPATAVSESLAECWGMDATDAGNLYVSLTNGPTTVTVTSCSLDPHDLDAVGRAAMDGACQALMNLDPDLDADVDVPGDPDDDSAPASAAGADCPCGCGCAIPATPGGCPCSCESCMHCKTDEDDDSGGGGAMENIPFAVAGKPLTEAHQALVREMNLQPGELVSAAMVNQAIAAKRASSAQTSAPETPAADPTQEKEPAMAESTTPAAETPGSDSGIDALSAKFDKLTDAITGLVTQMTPTPAAAESAPAESVAEAAPSAPVTESDDDRIARLVAEGIAKALPQAVQEHVETTGGPSRKGLVTPVSETAGAVQSGLPEGWPSKPLHEYTPEEWSQTGGRAVVGAILGDRTPQ
ncbi:DUF6582 domain-containing protein [Streptomyces sp. NPDC051994]|uniref:DUF6582 domain-containing protein n=1 Tax=unclassified Streptomyces TaxID=2593676 RepID=UPI003446CB1E